MYLERPLLAVLTGMLLLGPAAGVAQPAPIPPVQADGILHDGEDLEACRDLLSRAVKAREAKDFAKAQALIRKTLPCLQGILARGKSEEAASLAREVADLAYGLNEWETALPAVSLALRRSGEPPGRSDPGRRILEERLSRIHLNLGHYEEALALRRSLISAYETDPPDDPSVLEEARLDLAVLLAELGRLEEARRIQEEVLQRKEQRLPPEHPEVLRAATDLADSIRMMGDAHGALEILNTALERREAHPSPWSMDLSRARMCLAMILLARGAHRESCGLMQRVVEDYEGRLPPYHQDLQVARVRLALLQAELGEIRDAYNLCLKAWESSRNTLPKGHPLRLWILVNLANYLFDMRSFDRAILWYEKCLEEFQKVLPEGHQNIQTIRLYLALAYYIEGRTRMALRLAEVALEDAASLIMQRLRTCSMREIDAYVLENRWILDCALSLLADDRQGAGTALLRTEAFHAAGARAGRLRRIILGDKRQEVQEAFERFQAASLKITPRKAEDIPLTVRARDQAERDLAETLSALPASQAVLEELTLEGISAALGKDDAAVVYLRYNRLFFPEIRYKGFDRIPSYLAFVLTPDGKAVRVELGPADAVDEAATDWKKLLEEPRRSRNRRGALAKTGARVRALVWDPLVKHLGGRSRIVLSPDADLSVIPFEALPWREGYLAQEYALCYVNALSFLSIPPGASRHPETRLVALGGPDFNAVPRRYRAGIGDRPAQAGAAADLAGLHGERFIPLGNGRPVISALPGSREEAEKLVRLHRELFGNSAAVFLEGATASRASLVELASQARYLHIATHGFAPEEEEDSAAEKSLPTDRTGPTLERESLDRLPSPDYHRLTLKEQISGLAPSLRCGLALAGFNLPDEIREGPGLITAEEIQGLDLSRCELAVLSACETGLGEIRSAQGIMSLQRALAVAGARGTVTTLWKVSDEATAGFFDRFYRKLWKDRLAPAEALRLVKLEMIGEAAAGIEAPSDGERRGMSGDAPEGRFPDPYYWAGFVYFGAPQ